MCIRWKLMLLLLAIALLPLVLLTVFTQRATYGLGHHIGRQARDGLTMRAERELMLLVNRQGALLGRTGDLMRLAVQLQASEVERLLAAEPPPAQRVYFGADYDEAGREPEDLRPSARHVRAGPDEQAVPIAISMNETVFTLPPGGSREDVADDIARLARMTPVYRRTYEGYPGISYWLYTTLENGLHQSYPGRGGYPADFEPREREWYHETVRAGTVRWTTPYIEVSTRRPVLTIAAPVHRPDGTLAGVTAIDVAVADVTEVATIPDLDVSTVKMVGLVPRDDFDPHRARGRDINVFSSEEIALFVLAESTDTPADTPWDAPYQATMLDAPDPEFRDMIRDMMAARSGVRRMDRHGRPALWAYGPVWENRTYLLVIVPHDEIIAEADRVQSTVLAMTRTQLKITAAVFGGISLIVVAVALVGSRTVTQPVRRLAAAAERIAAGDFNARVDIQTHDELGALGRTFDAMIPHLRDRMQIRQSLALAMEVQQHLLPREAPRIEGLDVAGHSIYCDETGGDYYDFLDLSELGPRELGIAVGDVTGHGIAAALMMTGARALLRSRAGQSGTLCRLMQEINRHLTADTPVGRFMTLYYLVLDAEGKRVRWASAGHDPAIVYDPTTDTFDEWDGGDIPLGIELEWEYREFARDGLRRDMTIVIGTDGIWESRNADGDLFGKPALREIIRRHAGKSAEEISRAITRAIAEFRGDRPQEDDVTLVVVKVL